MKEFYTIQEGAFANSNPENANVVVCTAPDEAEKNELVETWHLDRHDLDSALDPDEISRVEFDHDSVFIVWKRPTNVSLKQQLRFGVSSVGLLLQGGKLMVISAEGGLSFVGREFRNISAPNSLVLRFIQSTSNQYLGHLKAIKMLNAELQAKLSTSMENRYLLQLFALSESLTYYLNALEANASVLVKLRTHADKLGFERKHRLETLDDIIIDHQQCLRQTHVFSSVLSGLMDARGNIINNNMNVLLKNLTLINVIFLPLNLFASIGGMSEFTEMTRGMDPGISYSLLLLTMAVLGWVTWIILIRMLKGRQGSADNGSPSVDNPSNRP